MSDYTDIDDFDLAEELEGFGKGIENPWVKEGTYEFVAEPVEFKASKSGDPQWVVDWKIESGPDKGRKVRDWITLTRPADPEKRKEAASRWARKMAKIGVSQEWISKNKPKPAHILEYIKGVRIKAEITVQEDRESNNINDRSIVLVSPGPAALKAQGGLPELPGTAGYSGAGGGGGAAAQAAQELPVAEDEWDV